MRSSTAMLTSRNWNRMSALPGMMLSYVQSPPPAIPVKLNYHYFRIDRSGPDWDAVQRARNLAVYVPEEFPAPQLELIIMLPPK